MAVTEILDGTIKFNSLVFSINANGANSANLNSDSFFPVGDEFLFTDQTTSTVIMKTKIIKRTTLADNTFSYKTVESTAREIMRNPARIGGSSKIIFNNDATNLQTADAILDTLLGEMVTQGLITGFTKPSASLTAKPRGLVFGGQTFDVIIQDILKKSGKFGWFIDSSAGQVLKIVDLTTGLPTKTIRYGDGTLNASTPVNPKFNAEPGWSSCEDASTAFRKYTIEGAGEFERIQETLDTTAPTPKAVAVFDPNPPAGLQILLGFMIKESNLITSRYIDPVTEEVKEGYFASQIDISSLGSPPVEFIFDAQFTVNNSDDVGNDKFFEIAPFTIGSLLGPADFVIHNLEYTLFKKALTLTFDTGDTKLDGENISINEDMWKYSAPFVPFTKDFTVDYLPVLQNKAIAKPIGHPAENTVHAANFPFEYSLFDNVTNAGNDGFTGRFIRGFNWDFNKKSLKLLLDTRPESDVQIAQKEKKKLAPISQTGYVGRVGQNDGFAGADSSTTQKAFSGKGGSNGTGVGGARSKHSRSGDTSLGMSKHSHDSNKVASGGELSPDTLIKAGGNIAKFSTLFNTRDFNGTKRIAISTSGLIESPIPVAPAGYGKLVEHSKLYKVTAGAPSGGTLTIQEIASDGITTLDVAVPFLNSTSTFIFTGTLLELASDWQGVVYVQNILRVV